MRLRLGWIITASLCVSGVAAAESEPTPAEPVEEPSAPTDPPPTITAPEAAEYAARVLDEHCADVAAAAATSSARALAEVSPALTAVSTAHDATALPYLLYWRGRLNLCLDREDRAREDLLAFVGQASSVTTLKPQRREALRLLRIIASKQRARPSIHTPGLAVAGGAFAGGVGLLAGLSSWQWTVALEKQTQFGMGDRDWTETETLATQGRTAADAQKALVASAVASGAAGATLFALSWIEPQDPALSKAAVVVLPTDAGLLVTLAGRF